MARATFFLLFTLLIPGGGGLAALPDPGGSAGAPPPAGERVSALHGSGGDAVSVSMFGVYEKYSKEPPSDGNTVRSFKAVPRLLRGKEVFQFNLSTLQDTELILFASLHFLYKRPRHHHHHHHHHHHQHQHQHQHQQQQRRTCLFRRPRDPHQQQQQPAPPPPAPRVIFHGALGNVTLEPARKGPWQAGNATAAVKRAREAGDLLLTVELDLGLRARQKPDPPQGRLPAADLPYILVYADDRAIGEPNSVAASLQRYGTPPAGEDASRSSASRIRRELRLRQIQSNDIPEAPYDALKDHELWQNTYFPVKAKAQPKGRRPGLGGGGRPQVLSFDERTMKKARRRQWSEPRACSRRYLRVDFADIGWSEWVLAPKSFDAYYCAGTCGFPIPKLVRPSNHATIQSIVRAVGIVPGIPEPCCVPEKMSPLSVLFLDPAKNMVLKVYPGMSVDTCACR